MNLIRIYGVGRSGSTVIGAYIAGHIKNAVHIGEAVRFDSPHLIKANPTCTCGVDVDECSVWQPVDRSNYRTVVESIHRTGYQLVVDSSKSGETPNVDGVTIVPIHLVKDPRASTWSWFRKREIVNPSGKKEKLKRVGWLELPRIIASNYKNFIKFRRRHYTLVEYDDFCDNPPQVLAHLVQQNRLGVETTDFYRKESNHGVGGNVARYGFDGVLRSENKWRDEAGILYRLVATLAYAPLLLWIKAARR